MAEQGTSRILIIDRLTPRSRSLAITAALLPGALACVLALIYVLSPEFYLRAILSPAEREQQAVEAVTFGAALIAGLCLVWCSFRLFTLRKHAITGPGAFLVAVAALAALFFAGEEVSWGQSLTGEALFTSSLLDQERETNLHNGTKIPIQSLGGLFLIAYFVAFPLVWHLRDRLPVPRDWAPAGPEWPVAVGILTAFAWGKLNDVYRAVVDGGTTHRVYIDFYDQVNEHKEMLVAVVLLVYAIYRITWTSRAVGLVTGHGADRRDAQKYTQRSST